MERIMRKTSFLKFAASTALFISVGACTNSSAPEDFDEYTSSSKKASSSSSVDAGACKTVKESLATPTKFNVANDSDTSWTFSWEYSRNSDRPETGFEIQTLDMDASSPLWQSEGTTNAEVTLYKLHGKSKVGKYYRVVAVDGCGESDASNRLQINPNGSTSVSTESEANLGVPTNFAITDTLGENRWLVSWSYSGDRDSYVLQRFVDKKNKWEKFLTVDDGTALETVVDTNAAGMYIRVAAVYEGKVSTYSSKIKVPDAVVKSTSTGTSSGGSKSSCKPAAPTNLKAVRIAPSVWRLYWDYKESSSCAETGFVVHSLDMKNPVGWKDVGKSAEDVNLYILSGENYRGKSYRVAALNGDKKSEWADPVEVNTETKYSTEYTFTTPTLLASVYKAAGGFDMRLVVTKNFPNEAMVSSDYTKSIEYEFRWGGSASGVKNAKIDVSETSVTTSFTDKEKLCSSYGQVRTIWTDVNGKTEVTEWSTPVGSLSGFNSSLGDSEKLCPYEYKEESSSSSAE
jgi:hypothetical protein